ncbi:MFS transporter [Nakamurella sp. YIM 132084]|uniref:MFS transporter n=1 Tax=Nakamurella leprariae TaxID=2803911 RepID=A0A938Y5G0_9ACTN|nr:MFS transporter [Nakamurella leprariae]
MDRAAARSVTGPSTSAPDDPPDHTPLPPPPRWGPDLRPLAVPEYRRLFIGQVFTVIGTQLTAVAVQAQIFDITGSSAWVGVSSLVALVPLVVFGLLGGAIADTYDRRTLLMITSSGIALTSIGLWLAALPDSESVWVILALLALQSGFFAVNQPTRSAIIPRIVPLALVPSANALSTTIFAAGIIIGPLLLGILLPLVGLPWLYFLDALATVGILYAVFRLPHLPPLGERRGRAKVVDGLKYLKLKPLLLMTFVVDIIAMVFGMPRALFPQMATETFGGPPEGGLALGWLNAAMGIGTLIGGLTSGWLQRVHRQGIAIIAAIVLWGVAVTFFGMTSVLWLAVLWLAIGGWADMVSATFRTTILQVEATDEMRGRMQGVFLIVVAGGPRVADLAHGFAASATTTEIAVVAGGILTVVGVVVAAWLGPSLWRFDNRKHEPDAG